MNQTESIRIAPSILSADFSRLGEQVRSVVEAGADLIHVDVMDGRFVPQITIGPPVVRAVHGAAGGRASLDVHLMVEEPERQIESFAEAGAGWISVHVEAARHLHAALGRIRDLGARPGVVLNPATPLVAVEEVLEDVDYVLLMSVNPGFAGQRFIPSSLSKVRRLRDLLEARGLDGVQIEVDGGIKEDNAGRVVEAGGRILVAGSAVFSSGDPGGSLRALKRAARGGSA